MTDRIDGQLAEAGQLLRDWRDEQEGLSRNAVGDDSALPLTPALPAPDRRWMAGAAAALVLLAGALAAVAWNQADDSVPVATESGMVALVPSSLDGWDQVSIQDPADSEPHEADLNELIVARPDSDPTDGQSVRLKTFEMDASTTPDGPGEPVEVGDRDGWLIEEPGGMRFLQVLPPDGQEMALTATSGPDVSTADLIALAAAFEPIQPLAEQPIPDGWVLKADGRNMLDGVQRGFSLVRNEEAPNSRQHSVSVVSVTGIPLEQVLWFLSWQPTEFVEVRGVQGLSFYAPGEEHSFGSLTWIDDAGMAVVISYSSDGPAPDGEAIMRSVAEDLVPVDAAGWDEFANQATGRAGDSGSSGSELTTDTTLLPPGDTSGTSTTIPPAQPPEPMLPAFSDLPGPSHGVRFTLPSGHEMQVYALDDTGQLCWRLEGDDNPRCDPGGPLAIDGEHAHEPRLATAGDGTTLAIYGFLPAGATSVQATAANQEEREGTAMVTGGRVWVAPLPLDYDASEVEVEVRYLDADDNVVAEASLKLRSARSNGS